MEELKFLQGLSKNLPSNRTSTSVYVTTDDGKIYIGNNTWNSKVDATLSSSSTNPIMNSTVTLALNNKANKIHEHSSDDVTKTYVGLTNKSYDENATSEASLYRLIVSNLKGKLKTLSLKCGTKNFPSYPIYMLAFTSDSTFLGSSTNAVNQSEKSGQNCEWYFDGHITMSDGVYFVPSSATSWTSEISFRCYCSTASTENIKVKTSTGYLKNWTPTCSFTYFPEKPLNDVLTLLDESVGVIYDGAVENHNLVEKIKTAIDLDARYRYVPLGADAITSGQSTVRGCISTLDGGLRNLKKELIENEITIVNTFSTLKETIGLTNNGFYLPNNDNLNFSGNTPTIALAINDLSNKITTLDTKLNKTMLMLNVDFNHQKFVDLGLPSGTLWAKYNVGASSETDMGDVFQFKAFVNQSTAFMGGDWTDPEDFNFTELIENTRLSIDETNHLFVFTSLKNNNILKIPFNNNNITLLSKTLIREESTYFAALTNDGNIFYRNNTTETGPLRAIINLQK